jgi:hypothetical protein
VLFRSLGYSSSERIRIKMLSSILDRVENSIRILIRSEISKGSAVINIVLIYFFAYIIHKSCVGV